MPTGRKIILNLPATVEMYTPNIYADAIEWFHRNVPNRDRVRCRYTPQRPRHGRCRAEFRADGRGRPGRGHAVRQRRSRTGNVDLVNLAMNLFSQGIDPELDISDIDALRRIAEYANRLSIHPPPMAVGDLVYTSFSARTRMPSRKASRHRATITLARGACHTYPSTPSTWAVRTRPSSGSTASRARAA